MRVAPLLEEAPGACGGHRTPLDRLHQAVIINYFCLNLHWMIFDRNGNLSNGGGGRSSRNKNPEVFSEPGVNF